jgi:hypothetical protein
MSVPSTMRDQGCFAVCFLVRDMLQVHVKSTRTKDQLTFVRRIPFRGPVKVIPDYIIPSPGSILDQINQDFLSFGLFFV